MENEVYAYIDGEKNDYTNRLPWVRRGQPGREEYEAEEKKILTRFRNDLEEAHGMKGHPKADLLYSKAWERGHSHGLCEVGLVYDDLVELVK